MIDWARVDELRNDMGSDGFDEVVELFLMEMDDRISAMKDGATESRADDLHFLKGSAANIGFSQVQQLCKQAETDDGFAVEDIWSCYEDSKDEFLNVLRQQAA